MGDPRLQLLQRTREKMSLSEMARRMSYSPATIGQVLKESYPGSTEAVLRRAEAVFGEKTITCPVMGDVTIQQCLAEQKKPCTATSPRRVQLARMCPNCTVRR